MSMFAVPKEAEADMAAAEDMVEGHMVGEHMVAGRGMVGVTMALPPVLGPLLEGLLAPGMIPLFTDNIHRGGRLPQYGQGSVKFALLIRVGEKYVGRRKIERAAVESQAGRGGRKKG
ncbi:hypothetical protein NEMBOFW57_001643 [Staphylotrichum longicolle]|uniref:Uncharacterized protein n=1 Tax=Staphylotrichum longicolle TaxID=669026 RepID=A0AAD4F2G5_9PEZI|nr:hypothetical protein NEMBOFW57_001643 [Staphylotrichum longicolle]